LIGAFVLGAPLWDEVNDPQALLRLIHRLVITVPVAVCLAIFAVRAFDRFTPNDWMKRVSDNETACSVVLASLILGVFWLCVQG
jgi:heme/copper-type cytochrome/quinol oxidase subunit 2